MSIQDAMAADLAIAFSDWGELAIYTPSGGEPVSIPVIMSLGEDLEDAQWRAALQASGTARVRSSDVPNPTING